eukprot:2928161-Pleurochrysis_carterae.AAC.3
MDTVYRRLLFDALPAHRLHSARSLSKLAIKEASAPKLAEEEAQTPVPKPETETAKYQSQKGFPSATSTSHSSYISHRVLLKKRIGRQIKRARACAISTLPMVRWAERARASALQKIGNSSSFIAPTHCRPPGGKSPKGACAVREEEPTSQSRLGDAESHKLVLKSGDKKPKKVAPTSIENALQQPISFDSPSSCIRMTFCRADTSVCRSEAKGVDIQSKLQRRGLQGKRESQRSPYRRSL